MGTSYFMTNWTPRASNQLGAPDSPRPRVGLHAGVVTFTFRASPGTAPTGWSIRTIWGRRVWTALPGTPRAGPEGNLQVQTGLGVAPQRFFRLRLL